MSGNKESGDLKEPKENVNSVKKSDLKDSKFYRLKNIENDNVNSSGFGVIAFENTMTMEKIEELIKEFNTNIENLTKGDENAGVAYTIKKHKKDNGFDLIRTEKGIETHGFECGEEGRCKFAFPIENGFITAFFDVNEGKDINVSQCGNLEAALKLVTIAKDRNRQINFSEVVMNELEKKRPDIKIEIKDILNRRNTMRM